MATLSVDTLETITSTIEDTVSYLTEELFESGVLISGETVYKVVSALADAKLAEFKGEVTSDL